MRSKAPLRISTAGWTRRIQDFLSPLLSFGPKRAPEVLKAYFCEQNHLKTSKTITFPQIKIPTFRVLLIYRHLKPTGTQNLLIHSATVPYGEGAEEEILVQKLPFPTIPLAPSPGTLAPHERLTVSELSTSFKTYQISVQIFQYECFLGKYLVLAKVCVKLHLYKTFTL